MLLTTSSAALAQRASENAVTNADDAFGTSVGLETTGIYTETDTRGFSPLKAGNARIDGIYYDPIGSLPGRIRASTSIRVGFSAGSYPFHAPTGIADFKLRPFPETLGASLSYTRVQFGGLIGELDLRIPVVKDHIGLTGGASYGNQPRTDGTDNLFRSFILRPIFRYKGIEFSPFVSNALYWHNVNHPLVVVTDTYLPKFPENRRYLGQKWARGSYDNNHYGATLKASVTDRLSTRAGLFHAVGDRHENYTEIFSLVAPSGLANHRLISDPFQELRSTSGEAQVAWRLGGDRFQHRLIAGYRFRDRVTESGGSAVHNLGQVIYGDLDREPEPEDVFSDVNIGHLRQASWLLGYIANFDKVATLNLGLQKARYRATSRDGRTGLLSRSRDNTWLYNATLGVAVTPAVSLYVGTERGLEDSGAAPENAANRNAQLPATRSTQYEGGVRWKFPGGQLAVNAFQITKPYFTFDEDNAFTQLGDVRHRGVEASLSGQFGKRLYILAGAVAMQPRVTGPARDLGLVGERPAGTPSVYARIDANYRTDIFGGLTPTAAITYTGKRAVGSRPLAALGGHQLMLPAATLVDLGVRQLVHLGRIPASFRLVVNNVLDKKTWKIVAANTLYVDERRRLTFAVTADF
jgi:iron complex outermembrane receptor protein